VSVLGGGVAPADHEHLESLGERVLDQAPPRRHVHEVVLVDLRGTRTTGVVRTTSVDGWYCRSSQTSFRKTTDPGSPRRPAPPGGHGVGGAGQSLVGADVVADVGGAGQHRAPAVSKARDRASGLRKRALVGASAEVNRLAAKRARSLVRQSTLEASTRVSGTWDQAR